MMLRKKNIHIKVFYWQQFVPVTLAIYVSPTSTDICMKHFPSLLKINKYSSVLSCVEWHIQFWRKLSCYSRAKVSANSKTLFSLVLSWRIGDFLSSLNSLKSTVYRYKFLVSSGILEDMSHRFSWSQCNTFGIAQSYVTYYLHRALLKKTLEYFVA